MHSPKVGAECSSETTTTRPFLSFFMASGTFHSCALRLTGSEVRRARRKQKHRRNRFIGAPWRILVAPRERHGGVIHSPSVGGLLSAVFPPSGKGLESSILKAEA